MAAGSLKLTVAAIIIIVLFASLYYLLFRDSVVEDKAEEVIETAKVVFARDPHLFRAGTNYELGRRNEGQKVTEFQRGDYLGVSANIETDREVVIETQILDQSGIIDENPMSSLKKESSGSFGLCCALVPDKEGSYLLRLKINGTEREIPFMVTPSGEN